MSQFRTEVLPFPWVPLAITVIGIGFLYLIGRWVYEFGQWVWFNRPAKSAERSDSEDEEDDRRKKRSSSSKRQKHRRGGSDSE